MSIKKLFRYFLYLVGLLLALVIVFFVSNVFDDSLKSEVAKELAWEAPVDWKSNNAFVLQAAMDSGRLVTEQDAYDVGVHRIETFIVSFKAGKLVEPEEISAKTNEGKLKINERLCDYVKIENCVQFYRQLPAATVSQLQLEQQTQLRLLALMKQQTRYQEVLPPSLLLPFPSYQKLLAAIETENLIAVRRFERAPAESLNALAQNLEFSSRLFRSSRILIGKMVYTAALQKQLRLVRELAPEIADAKFKGDELRSLQKTLNDLAQEKLTLDAAMLGERQFVLNNVKTMFNADDTTEETVWSDRIARGLMRKNAAMNLMYEWLEFDREFFRSDVQHYAQAKQERDRKQQDLLGWGIDPYYLRDPINKILISVMQGTYDSYFERVLDLRANLDLTRLQLALASGVTTPEGLGAYAKQQGIELKSAATVGYVYFDVAEGKTTLTATAFHPSNQIYQNAKQVH
ncbi:MAG: hypothetical protein E6Q34_09995 [Burkholderiaceae bacterium]|nr:MAG: hypothetical protein E6Q34_09995 [Burkholderiaceae bacterium]